MREFTLIGLVLLALQGSALAGDPAIEAFPPVVVGTVPAAGEQSVDPATREIRVTFSKPMMTHEMWSFVYAKPATFPEIAGPIHYLATLLESPASPPAAKRAPPHSARARREYCVPRPG